MSFSPVGAFDDDVFGPGVSGYLGGFFGVSTVVRFDTPALPVDQIEFVVDADEGVGGAAVTNTVQGAVDDREFGGEQFGLVGVEERVNGGPVVVPGVTGLIGQGCP